MKRIRCVIATACISTVALAGIGAGLASTASAQTPSTGLPAATGKVNAASHGLIINIKNNSTHNLRWVEDDYNQPTNTPKAILRPGETDRLVYKASGGRMTASPNYQVGDTQYRVYPVFSVPLVGPNGYSCTANDRSADSPVGSKCDIGSGWEPDAHLTFIDR
jgi:hypothetical protein